MKVLQIKNCYLFSYPFVRLDEDLSSRLGTTSYNFNILCDEGIFVELEILNKF